MSRSFRAVAVVLRAARHTAQLWTYRGLAQALPLRRPAWAHRAGFDIGVYSRARYGKIMQVMCELFLLSTLFPAATPSRVFGRISSSITCIIRTSSAPDAVKAGSAAEGSRMLIARNDVGIFTDLETAPDLFTPG
jgi:hypothetical protein